MTPEEKAVIQAAIAFVYGTPEKRGAHSPLLAAVENLPVNGIYTPDRWVPATFADCLAGDRIRIGDQESDVLWTTGPQQFHVKQGWRDGQRFTERWDHIELRMDLSANPGRRVYLPSTPCEILCTSERAAKLELSTLFHPVQPVDK